MVDPATSSHTNSPQTGQVDKETIAKEIKKIDETIADISKKMSTFTSRGLRPVAEAIDSGNKAIEDLQSQRTELEKQLNQKK